MNFEEEINEMENLKFDDDFIIKKGSVPILFTAPHTMQQVKEDGLVKFPEPYTKAIAIYLNKYFDTSYMIKIKDTGLDSNRDNNDEFKQVMIDFIKNNDIKLVIDLHGASKNRDFDVEFGTLENLTAKNSTIKMLENTFFQMGIDNIKHNDPFKGGAITRYVFKFTNSEVIQLEINHRYRDFNDLNKLKLLCQGIGEFIKKFEIN